MAKCGNCGAESLRVISSWTNAGVQLPDKCKHCSPEDFEKHSDPSTKKIWTGPEFAPNDYEYVNGQLQMKPEAISSLEEQACGLKSIAAQGEIEATRQAEDEKRRNRRTKPLTQQEIEQSLAFVDKVLRPMIEDTETAYEV